MNLDLDAIIAEFRSELERVQKVIDVLEHQQAQYIIAAATHKGRRRGRKSLGDAERQEVSRRMKAYWAKRREEKEKSRGAPVSE